MKFKYGIRKNKSFKYISIFVAMLMLCSIVFDIMPFKVFDREGMIIYSFVVFSPFVIDIDNDNDLDNDLDND